jgi:hypothetical protein
MATTRLLRFLAGPELGLLSTLIFAGLYTWPFLTFARPSATFRFVFTAWMLHIALIALTSFARKRLEDGVASESDER